MCGLFFENGDIDIANHANDITPYVCSPDLDSAISKLNRT